MKIRPSILIAELALSTIAIVAIRAGMEQIAVGAVTAIAATISKLVESEEKGG